jgi:pSer/pThr/pTyr-binding forkhead associated (FHA) protein
VGRSRDCDIVLADANVSRRHAEIRWDAGAGAWTVADLGSTNGVRVGGARITGAALIRDGERIELGTVPIGFEVER